MTQPKTSEEITIAVMTEHADKHKLWLPADEVIPKERVEEMVRKMLNEIEKNIVRDMNDIPFHSSDDFVQSKDIVFTIAKENGAEVKLNI